MTLDIQPETTNGFRYVHDQRENTSCILSREDIRKLNRDLRILIATNGTLTRILNVVADEQIVVEILNQQILNGGPKPAEVAEFAGSRVLRRNILLKGRKSGNPFVAAESLIAIDLLPARITAGLTGTDDPIGEVMNASTLETFKEEAKVWVGELPGWLELDGYDNPRARIVARRYRVIAGGQPVFVITEYFLRDEFEDAP